MKQKIKLRGHLKSYLQVTLILGILLAAVNAGIYFININVCFSAGSPRGLSHHLYADLFESLHSNAPSMGRGRLSGF